MSRARASTVLLGLFLGFALSRIGFHDYREVHRMFLVADWRLIATFGGGVFLCGLGLRLFFGGAATGGGVLHRGVIPGSVLFGAGWALCGACPAISLVQLGHGQWSALWTIGGIVAGTAAYGRVHARWLRWDAGSCGSDEPVPRPSSR
jgi:hypothetical protein